MTTLQFVMLGLGIFVAGGTQRITGLGFALVSSPLLVLTAGPNQGVLLTNLLSLCANLIVLSVTWREIDLRPTMLLAAPAVVTIPVGALVVRHLGPAPLMIVIGALVVIALTTVVFVPRARVLRGTRGALGAGALSGFLNVTAGVGGPAMTLYAVSIGWAHAGFVASMQLYFALLNAGSIAAKGVPSLPVVELVTALGALTAGIAVGHLAKRFVAAGHAQTAMVVVAFVGATATLVKGILLW